MDIDIRENWANLHVPNADVSVLSFFFFFLCFELIEILPVKLSSNKWDDRCCLGVGTRIYR